MPLKTEKAADARSAEAKPKPRPAAAKSAETKPAPAEGPAPAAAPPPADVKADGKMVTVFNPQGWHYVQPVTGIRIGANETKQLRDDGWLGLQVKAGILKRK